MKHPSQLWKISLLVSFVLLLGGKMAPAQDPVEVDAKHYKVELENDQVRVLRIKYGPGEKSVMHDHPDSTAVFLTEHHVKFTYPDGKTEQVDAKAGETRWTKGGKHLPENAGTKPFELILVELKIESPKTK
jgi:quercetin dioxygenase-like cupin family protein